MSSSSSRTRQRRTSRAPGGGARLAHAARPAARESQLSAATEPAGRGAAVPSGIGGDHDPPRQAGRDQQGPREDAGRPCHRPAHHVPLLLGGRRVHHRRLGEAHERARGGIEQGEREHEARERRGRRHPPGALRAPRRAAVGAIKRRTDTTGDAGRSWFRRGQCCGARGRMRETPRQLGSRARSSDGAHRRPPTLMSNRARREVRLAIKGCPTQRSGRCYEHGVDPATDAHGRERFSHRSVACVASCSGALRFRRSRRRRGRARQPARSRRRPSAARPGAGRRSRSGSSRASSRRACAPCGAGTSRR